MQALVSVKINGASIEKDLALFGKKAEKVYAQAVQVAAQKFRDNTKELPPVSAKRTGYNAKGMPTDKGNLRSSIKRRRISALAAGVFVGRPAEKYGIHVHQGHKTRGGKQIPARPFFQWSLEMGGQKMIDDVMKKFAKLLP